MIRVATIYPAGSWSGTVDDTVSIDFDRRHRRRHVLTAAGGAELLIDLPQAIRLRDGDGLALEDGRMVRVQAAAEELLEIHAHGPAELVRIAWHLGNRHLPVQLLGDRIRIRRDHVIEAMVHGLGGHAAPVEAPFDPEAGAYAGGHTHDHDDEERPA